MERKADFIVIGAGPNGLISAAYLTKIGLKGVVLERLPETGGGLLTQEICGFKMNHHATYMLLAELMPPIKDLGLYEWGVKFIRPEVQMAFLMKKPLIFYLDLKKTVDMIENVIGSEDAERFKKMFLEFEEMFSNFLLPATYYPPLEPLEQVEKLEKSDELGRKIMKISEMTPLEILDFYGIKSPELRGALLYIICLFGLEHDEPVGFLVPIYVTRVLKSAIVKGGTHHLASALRRVIEFGGSSVITTAEVKRIIVEDDKVVGVETEKEMIYSNIVISTLTPELNAKLLEGTKIEGEIKDIAERWEWEKISLFVAHRGILGSAPKYPGFPEDTEKALMVVMGYNGENDVLEHIEKKTMTKGMGSTLSLFDKLLVPNHVPFGEHHILRWEGWAGYEDDWSYERRKEFAKKCFDVWASYSPTLAEAKVIVEMSWSPKDIENQLITMKRGSIKHGAYLTLQMGYNRPHPDFVIKTPIKGLYFGGASSHPGGMVIAGPGYLSARAVAEDLKINWKWENPAEEAIKRRYL